MIIIGLDNGVFIKGYTRVQLPKSFRYPFEKDYESDKVDICYWRKAWNIRNWFLNECFPKREINDYYFNLGIKEVETLRKIITYYLKHSKEWNETSSIWTFEEIKSNLKEQKYNLKVLIKWMKKNPDAEVIFYDSY